MGQTDLFGTFLDALQASSVDAPMSALQRSDMPRPYRPGHATLRSSKPGLRSKPAGNETAPIDPTDRVFLRLVELERSGNSAVELTSLIPESVSSLSKVLQAISKLEDFGIVEKSGDNRISLTDVGKQIAQSVT